MSVLLSAFACDPKYGSDEEVGWQWAKQLSNRGVDVTVITRRSHRIAIEDFVVKTGQCINLRLPRKCIFGTYPVL
jgi:replication-associated recombination protein RarA